MEYRHCITEKRNTFAQIGKEWSDSILQDASLGSWFLVKVLVGICEIV
jgi:hypothetical protein